MKYSYFFSLFLLLPLYIVAQEPDTLTTLPIQDNLPSVVLLAEDLESETSRRIFQVCSLLPRISLFRPQVLFLDKPGLKSGG